MTEPKNSHTAALPDPGEYTWQDVRDMVAKHHLVERVFGPTVSADRPYCAWLCAQIVMLRSGELAEVGDPADLEAVMTRLNRALEAPEMPDIQRLVKTILREVEQRANYDWKAALQRLEQQCRALRVH
jgi:hypothetical protein